MGELALGDVGGQAGHMQGVVLGRLGRRDGEELGRLAYIIAHVQPILIALRVKGGGQQLATLKLVATCALVIGFRVWGDG